MHRSRLDGWTRLLALALAVAPALLQGCRCGGGGVGDACDTNADCDPGLVCDPIAGECRAGVGTDGGGGADAASTDGGGPGTDGGAATDAGGGTDGGSPSGLPTGAACTASDECAPAVSAGATAICIPPPFGFPGGYCSNTSCDPLVTGECPGPDAFCFVDAGSGDASCLDGCLIDADCRPDYNCFDTGLITTGVPGGPLACLPLCTGNTDCDGAAGEACDMMTFTCYTPGASVGDACADNTECPVGSFCLGESFLGFPGGYCGGNCDPTDPGGGMCAAGGTCYETDSMDPTQGTCLADCPGGTCPRPGYTCDTTLPYGGMLMDDACVPDCLDDSVCTVATFTCETLVGLCQPPVTNFGGPCDTQLDCAGGLCVTEVDSGAPFGNCQDECDPATPVAGDCPAGGVCIDLSGFVGTTFGLCYVGCDPLAPVCRAGYECGPVPPGTDDVCLPDCTVSSQCQSACCEAGFLGGSCVDPGGATCL